VAADVIVMPRSCSCSIQSIVAAPSCTSPICAGARPSAHMLGRALNALSRLLSAPQRHPQRLLGRSVRRGWPPCTTCRCRRECARCRSSCRHRCARRCRCCDTAPAAPRAALARRARRGQRARRWGRQAAGAGAEAGRARRLAQTHLLPRRRSRPCTASSVRRSGALVRARPARRQRQKNCRQCTPLAVSPRCVTATLIRTRAACMPALHRTLQPHAASGQCQ